MTLPLPQDSEAESALLATLLAPGALAPDSFPEAHQALLACRPEFLVSPNHRVVLAAALELYRQGMEPDSLALKAELEMRGQLGRIGGSAGLMDLLNGSEVARPLVLVARLRDLWHARELIRVGQELSRKVQDQPALEVNREASARLAALASDGAAPTLRKASALLDRIMAGEAFRDYQGRASKLAWFGVDRWDQALETAPGHLVLLAARPGVGKTALVIQGAWTTARRGERPLIVSLEMDADEVEARLASWSTQESARHFRDGRWTASAAEQLIGDHSTLDRITTWCHPSGVPFAKVEAAIRDAVRREGVTSVWLDYFTLIRKPSIRGATDAAAWGDVSTGLKRLAQELRICIVLLSQLNREGDAGEPKLSDLRETGQLEQDGNAVIMLWPKDPKAQDKVQECRTVFGKLAKNRSGASGWKTELDFYGATSRFLAVGREGMGVEL